MIVIYPYKMIKRTEYSKFKIFDNEDKNISNTEIGKKILEDYNKQITNPKKYFDIDNNTLNKVLKTVRDDNIKYLFIPEGITSIANDCIQYQNANFISLPNTLQFIGEDAFACSSIQAIELPDSIQQIDKYCFRGCMGLERVKVPSNFTILSELMFTGCENLKEINFPDNLKIISKFCFNGCKSLKKITIPDTVERIEAMAFNGCSGLEYIKLPNNLKSISDGLFDGCENLRKIEIPNSVLEIGREAFSCTKSLNSITLPKNLKVIGWRPFADSEIKTLVFKYDLKNIMGNDPYGRPANLIYNINKLIIDKGVQTITPVAIGKSGIQITSIDYLGTKQEFNKFKENNKKLFELLPNLENVNFTKSENLQNNQKLNHEIDNDICL